MAKAAPYMKSTDRTVKMTAQTVKSSKPMSAPIPTARAKAISSRTKSPYDE